MIEEFIVNNQWLVVVLALWTIPWTGVALWKSARKGSQGWFVALLLLNTLAILEILYIFVFSKKDKVVKSTENKEESG
jgi:hypothetical protein